MLHPRYQFLDGRIVENLHAIGDKVVLLKSHFGEALDELLVAHGHLDDFLEFVFTPLDQKLSGWLELKQGLVIDVR